LRAFFDVLREIVGRPEDGWEQNLKNLSKELRKMLDKFQKDFQGVLGRFCELKAQHYTVRQAYEQKLDVIRQLELAQKAAHQLLGADTTEI